MVNVTNLTCKELLEDQTNQLEKLHVLERQKEKRLKSENKTMPLGLIKKSLVYDPIQLKNAMRAGGFFFFFILYIFLLSVSVLLQQILKR